MIRRDNHHRVNVRPGQQLAVVVIGGAAVILAAGSRGVRFLDTFLGFVAAHRVHVTDRQDLDLAVADQPVQVPTAHRPVADQAHCEPFARRDIPIRPPHEAGIIHGRAAAPERQTVRPRNVRRVTGRVSARNMPVARVMMYLCSPTAWQPC